MPKGPWDKYAPDASTPSNRASGPWDKYAPEAPDFSANPDSEGVYSMNGPGGKTVKVPYSKIGDASKTGLKMSDADRKRYLTDAAADPQLKNIKTPDGVSVTGKNSAGQPIYGGPKEESSVERFADAEYGAIGDAAKGVVQFLDPRATEEEKQRGETSTLDSILRYPNRLVAPHVAAAKQADADLAAGRYSEAAGHGLAAAIPVVGPWAAQVGEKVGQQAGAGNYAGAVGTVAGNAIVSEAPKVIGKAVVSTAKAVPSAARSTAESLTRTGPKELRKLAEDTHKANQEAVAAAAKKDAENATQHLEKTQDALHKTAGAELESTAANTAAIDKAKADHAKALADTQVHNQRVIDKHNAEVERITNENNAADQAIEQRKDEESKLQQETTDYYAKEDAVKAKAKGIENAAWSPWREKMKDVKVDGGEIAEPLKKIAAISPEVTRIMKQLTPDPSEAAPESMYAQDRAAIMKSQGITGDYWSLPPDRQAIIDQIAASSGFEPDPIDFNPESGVGIPVEQIHRAKSILGRNIYSGKFEGIIKGEMQQLYKALDQAETRASLNAGALDDLNSARKATREYQEAFGRDRHMPKTQDEIRKQQANPDQFKEENDQERLDAASKHDPSLVSDYEKVKSHRAQIKKMKTEDQLRKSQKEIPHPPSIDDLREGYRLKAAPAPSEAKLNLPKRVAPPDKPQDVVPEQESIKTEDIQEQREKNVQKFGERLREMGVRRALYSMAAGLSGAIPTAVLGHPVLGLAADVAAGLSVLGGSHAIAALLDKPSVVNWISKISPKDIAEFEKLPPEQKALFTKDMRDLAQAAKAKGVAVSPALSTFIGGAAATQGPSSLREEANSRNPKQYSQTATGPNGHKIGSNDGSTWYDVQTGQLVQ